MSTASPMPFSPSLFFHWQASIHCLLFASCESVLELIPAIGPYLELLQLGTLEIDVPEGVFLVNRESIFIGKGTRIEPGAYIQGPCWIGENCTIRHGAYIRGNCIAEEGVVIGHATEVKNAYFFSNAHAAHFAYVGDSVLGHSVNLGAGVKLANVRFDKREIVIPYEGNKYPTGQYKWGAILGDRCQIGCNAVTNPGTLIGPDEHCLPCEWIKGVRLTKPLAFEEEEGLHMRCLGEEIENCTLCGDEGRGSEAFLCQDIQVPCQSGGHT